MDKQTIRETDTQTKKPSGNRAPNNLV